MFRKATQADAAALTEFLRGYAETSMFLLNNLEGYGLDETSHTYGTAFHLREAAGVITGVFGVTNGGFLLCQMPGLTRAEAQACAALVKGFRFRGMTGEAAQVPLILDALALPSHLWGVNADDPLYALDLKDLTVPEALIRPPHRRDFLTLAKWFAAYGEETGTGAADDAMHRAERALNSETLCILEQGGEAVAMADINASTGDVVQIGGVYVPPERRGAGLGGTVVSAMLGLLRDKKSMRRAILFAASVPAAKSYERIGFRQLGAYRVAVLNAPHVIGEPL